MNKSIRDKEAGAVLDHDLQDPMSGGTSCIAPASTPYNNKAELAVLVKARETLSRLTDQALLGIRPETWEINDLTMDLNRFVLKRIEVRHSGGDRY